MSVCWEQHPIEINTTRLNPNTDRLWELGLVWLPEQLHLFDLSNEWTQTTFPPPYPHTSVSPYSEVKSHLKINMVRKRPRGSENVHDHDLRSKLVLLNVTITTASSLEEYALFFNVCPDCVISGLRVMGEESPGEKRSRRKSLKTVFLQTNQ